MVTVIQDIDRIKEILKQYKGCHAQVWAYSVTFRRMAIRLWMDMHSEQLLLFTGGTFYIQGFIDRENANITIGKETDEYRGCIYSVIDESAGFKVLANSHLMIIRGDFSEFNMHFDSLFDMEKAIFE